MNRKNLLNKMGLILAGFLYVWATWQHEILVFQWVQSRWTESFAFFSGVETTKGIAYDFTLLLAAFAFLLGLASLWLWDDSKEK